jgi:hypothetical protein
MFYCLLIVLKVAQFTPDWKVWKLRGGDFENLIVNIWRASKVRGGHFSPAQYKLSTLEFTLLSMSIMSSSHSMLSHIYSSNANSLDE